MGIVTCTRMAYHDCSDDIYLGHWHRAPYVWCSLNYAYYCIRARGRTYALNTETVVDYQLYSKPYDHIMSRMLLSSGTKNVGYNKMPHDRMPRTQCHMTIWHRDKKPNDKISHLLWLWHDIVCSLLLRRSFRKAFLRTASKNDMWIISKLQLTMFVAVESNCTYQYVAIDSLLM